MRPKLQKQSVLKLAGRIIPRAKLSGTILMRPKLQKQSALKLVGRIILGAKRRRMMTFRLQRGNLLSVVEMEDSTEAIYLFNFHRPLFFSMKLTDNETQTSEAKCAEACWTNYTRREAPW